MELTNFSRSKELEIAAETVLKQLHIEVIANQYISAKISGVKFTRNGDILVDAEILFRKEDGIFTKRASYLVVGDEIFQSLPQKALCDENK